MLDLLKRVKKYKYHDVLIFIIDVLLQSFLPINCSLKNHKVHGAIIIQLLT